MEVPFKIWFATTNADQRPSQQRHANACGRYELLILQIKRSIDECDYEYEQCGTVGNQKAHKTS